MSSAPTLAPELDTTHPFTTGQALRAGISSSQLRTGDFRKLAKGKWVSAARRPDATLHAEAALLGHGPDAFVSHATAARLFRMPVPDDPEEHVSVFSPGARRERTGVRTHVASADTRVLVYRGVRVAAPAAVLVQLAGSLSLVDLVVLGDFMVRRQWYTSDELVALCAASSEQHARRALRAARYVRDGVDSPMESRLRMLLVLAGFPEPKVNHIVYDEDGVVRRRFDLCYLGVKVIVEYDGRQHIEVKEQWDHDIDRREELDDEEWRIIVVTAKGIYTDPESTLRRVRKALRSRGMTGLPTTYRRGWREHFPGRPATA